MSPLLPHYYLGVIRGNSIWRISICIERVVLDICQQPSGFLPSKAMLLRYMQILGCFIVSRNNGCTIAFILVGKISQVVICEVAISWYFASFSPCKSTFSYWIYQYLVLLFLDGLLMLSLDLCDSCNPRCTMSLKMWWLSDYALSFRNFQWLRGHR